MARLHSSSLRYNTNGELAETSMQKLVMQWVRAQAHLSPYVIHIPNEGKRSLQSAAILKAMGMRSGVSDLFIALPRGCYHGAWIELKTSKGRISENQKEFFADMQTAGYYTAVCRSFDEAIDCIRDYYTLR